MCLPGMELSNSIRGRGAALVTGLWTQCPDAVLILLVMVFLLDHSRAPSSLVLQKDGVNTCTRRSWEQAWPPSQPHHVCMCRRPWVSFKWYEEISHLFTGKKKKKNQNKTNLIILLRHNVIRWIKKVERFPLCPACLYPNTSVGYPRTQVFLIRPPGRKPVNASLEVFMEAGTRTMYFRRLEHHLCHVSE